MKPFYHEAVVEVDGETLTLVCDFSTIDKVESLTGENWDAVLQQLADPPRSVLVKLLWAFLSKRREGVTLDDAAGLVMGPHQAAVCAIMGDLVRRACNIPDDPTEVKGENPPKRRGARKAS